MNDKLKVGEVAEEKDDKCYLLEYFLSRERNVKKAKKICEESEESKK